MTPLDPAAPISQIIGDADLHVWPLFTHPPPIELHPSMAERLEGIRRVRHRYVPAFHARGRLGHEAYACGSTDEEAYREALRRVLDATFAQEASTRRRSDPTVPYDRRLARELLPGARPASGAPHRPRLIPGFELGTRGLRAVALPEAIARQASETGLCATIASASSYAAAVLDGLYELLARDAVAGAGRSRRALRPIRLGSLPRGGLADAFRALRKDGHRPALFDATRRAGLPALLVSLDPRAAHPSAAPALGAGSDLHPLRAAAKAFLSAMEALRPSADALPTPEPWKTARPLADGSRVAPIGLADLPNESSLTTLRDFERVLGRVHDLGVRPVFADLTPAEFIQGSVRRMPNRYCLVAVAATRLRTVPAVASEPAQPTSRNRGTLRLRKREGVAPVGRKYG